MHLFATFTNAILHAREVDQGDPEEAFVDTPSLVNPYTTLRIQARLALYPRIPKTTCNQLFVLSAIYAVIALVAVLSLAVAAKRRNLGFIDKVRLILLDLEHMASLKFRILGPRSTPLLGQTTDSGSPAGRPFSPSRSSYSQA